MLLNYLQIAFRHLLKNKIFTLINIAGLSISICAVLVIYVILQYEFSFDKFHKDLDQIYRVTSLSKYKDQEFPNVGVPVPMAELMQEEVQGIQKSAIIHEFRASLAISYGQNNKPDLFNSNRAIITSKEYFEIFSYEWLEGSPNYSLNDPNKVVLLASRASRLFPGENYSEIIGKSMFYNDSIEVIVSGVIKDFEGNSDLIFNEFISYATIDSEGLGDYYYVEEWDNINSMSQVFIKLEEGVSVTGIETNIPPFVEKYKEINEAEPTIHALQPLRDMHFNSVYPNFNGKMAHKPTLNGFVVVASFLLLLGCINYINLTTAQSHQRGKEIGIRKTMGSYRSQLTWQFIVETIVLTTIAAIIGFQLAPLVANVFSDFIPFEIEPATFWNWEVAAALFLLVLIVGTLAGLYPGLLMSRLNPIKALKNGKDTVKIRTRNTLLRQSLTTVQFSIALFFIISTMIITQQIQFALNKDMGFDQKAIVFFNLPINSADIEAEVFGSFKNKVNQIPEFKTVSVGSHPPAANSINMQVIKSTVGTEEKEVMVDFKFGDEAYIQVYNIPLVAGNNLRDGVNAKEYLINEKLAKALGFEDINDAVNHVLNDSTVIRGVIADFNLQSVHSPIRPAAISNRQPYRSGFHIKLQSTNKASKNWQNGLFKAENVWKSTFPNEPFEYKFFDESIADFYESERRIAMLIRWTTGVTTLISALGLLGLAIFATQKRTKEIGIRKTFGASVLNLVGLLSKSLLKPVMWAFIFAIPLAWYGMSTWLEKFNEKIEMEIWMFLAPGFVLFLFALVVVASQSLRTAFENPIKSLQTE